MTPQEYKDKTIAACRELVEKYRNPEGQIFGLRNYDPLCLIYREHWCGGCFIGTESGTHGCMSLPTETNLRNNWDFKNNKDTYPLSFVGPAMRGAMDMVLIFYDSAISILEAIDADYFTPEGWKYEAFAAIRELDRKLAEGVIK